MFKILCNSWRATLNASVCSNADQLQQLTVEAQPFMRGSYSQIFSLALCFQKLLIYITQTHFVGASWSCLFAEKLSVVGPVYRGVGPSLLRWLTQKTLAAWLPVLCRKTSRRWMAQAIVSLKLTISWRRAWNSKARRRGPRRKARLCIRTRRKRQSNRRSPSFLLNPLCPPSHWIHFRSTALKSFGQKRRHHLNKHQSK